MFYVAPHNDDKEGCGDTGNTAPLILNPSNRI